MSDELNLNEEYKNIVQNQEQQAQEEPQDLGKVDMNRFGRVEAQDAELALGYQIIPSINLPSGGMFYSDDIKISIRSAKVSEIRNFSSVDENNVFDVDDKLNYILENCVQISSSKKRLSYKDLCEEDRFYIILSIRDLTFPEPESKLTIEHIDKKGKKHQVDISKDYFTYFKIPDTLDKYYDADRKSFIIETKSFGTIEMRPPSIGVMKKMKAYIQERQEKKEKIDQSVLQVMPYMVMDWRGLDEKDIFKFEIEMNGWTNKKFSLIYKLAEQMKVGIKPDMRVQIGDGWEDVPIGFRDGIKSIFIVQDFAGELL
jgi:hypothetical protein